jgi:hypothetical protein
MSTSRWCEYRLLDVAWHGCGTCPAPHARVGGLDEKVLEAKVRRQAAEAARQRDLKVCVS